MTLIAPRPTRGPHRLRLSELGPVRGGYVEPRRGATEPGGDFLAFQASDIAPGGAIAWATLPRITPAFDGTRYLVRDGDILVPLRAVRPEAVVIQDPPPSVIAADHWAILSPDPDVVESDYLAWYLNHRAAAARLEALMQGTKLRFLSLKVLRDFEVEIPPLEVQRRIARAHALHERVTELEEQLAAARRELVDTLTLTALRRTGNTTTDE